MKKSLWIFAVLLFVCAGKVQAQVIASFSLSAGAAPLSGWTNVFGDPHTTARSATANGITLTSVNWATDASGICAEDAAAPHGGTFFPDLVLRNHWFQAGSNAVFSQGVPQIRLSGLNKDSFYIIRMSASSVYTAGDPTQYIVAGDVVYSSQTMNPYNNLATGVTFQHIYPDASGVINIYVNTTPGKNVAYLAGVQVISGTSTVGIPTVAITSPDNNDILVEKSNVTINVSAFETGSSISKVEFYSDTTKLGESSTAPYSFTWVNPDAGHYTIRAKATDVSGTSSTASINISIESLSSFWSLTGNTHANGDSNFVGTVDTNRLAFRTNNIERMSISKDGNTTIGGKDTASHPALRIYKNGDLVAGTTMDRSVNTEDQVGMRYYSKIGMFQVGASDRLDTTVNPIVYGPWPSSGIIVNSDVSNTIKGKMMNTFFAGDANTMDTLTRFENVIIASENSHFTKDMSTMICTVLAGYGTYINAPVIDALISGNANQLTKPVQYSNINGFVNTTMDITSGSLINGAYNQFGGFSQLVSGQYLVNRTPLGTTLGNSNVDFATLPYTGSQQTNAPNIDQYPLLALGNGANAAGTIRSNALTVLFNGRTQINTSGFTNQLTQANATPAAALDVVSTNTGVLLPRLTNTQRNAIVAGDLKNGLLLYNTDSSVFQYYNGSVWNSVGAGGGTGGTKWIFSSGTTGTVYDVSDNVGIGTNDTKGYKLAVNGAAIFNTVKVKPTDLWPDYVFRKGYKLPGLGELEQYIQKYRHLPGVITAREAEQKGIDVGENQATLLKKVEELTLYLIDENKQLKTQNAKLAEQDRKNEDLQRQIDELKALLLKK